ncbi:alkaline phosphatase PafA [Flavobacterium facile]|uniref:alkaline phosphatase PafA n=1 Tax=Flavobacterium facile TaxID=2893174 RepID=UPI002E798C36|nr:alkaline phosphatase PafA [Flavobacterium sp. T-12]
MKKLIVGFLVFSTFLNAQEKPKLVVGIVVDQMKMEYLYRFANDFSDNGFKKLMKKGFTFHNMHYNYMPTYTAPGHAAIFTGALPNVNGIVGNDWFNKAIGKEMYCTDDESVTTLVEGTESEGKMSPKNLFSTTITDELKLSTNFKSKVIGISIKDRGAILPAGHFADWAFWYTKTGDFISSSFYGQKLPDWAIQFNGEKNYLKYVEKGWDLFKSKETYNESLNDNNPYEGKLFKKTPFFPYDMKEMFNNNDAGVLRTTPYGNNLVADFAKKAIENEKMGADEITDFLTMSFSSTDYVGHVLGPRSIELQDTYLRLDETIADLLTYLDNKVGKGQYLVFLTADHAGAENATYLKDNKYAVESLNSKNLQQSIIEFSQKTFGENVLLDYSNFNVFINKEKVKQKGLELNKVKQQLKEFLMSQHFISNAFTEEEIQNSGTNNSMLQFVANGYDPKQNGELVLLFKPGFMEYSSTGTTHGSPYSYDTHVPCLFYGWKIKKGESYNKKTITQIAPTLAQKLKITMPNGTQSEVLEEVLTK